MSRILQSAFLILSIVFVQVFSYAQSDRVKTAKAETAPVILENANTAVLKSKAETAASKIDIPQPPVEFRSSNTLQKKNMDSLSALKNNSAISESPNLKTANTESFTDNSVRYLKETLPEQATVANSERKTVKPTASVNYKQREVKQDIHPVQDFTHPRISESKRLYLQQEADDLQVEINLNRTNPDYDTAKKQKQLEDIRKLVQP
ncbi:MAG: hypothetical protein IPM95_05815 [Sphingobacteriales bacterium]|jgi:hypothetical protein|nr:hypothetical protein [Sphingobacteriales bacterium]